MMGGRPLRIGRGQTGRPSPGRQYAPRRRVARAHDNVRISSCGRTDAPHWRGRRCARDGCRTHAHRGPRHGAGRRRAVRRAGRMGLRADALVHGQHPPRRRRQQRVRRARVAQTTVIVVPAPTDDPVSIEFSCSSSSDRIADSFRRMLVVAGRLFGSSASRLRRAEVAADEVAALRALSFGTARDFIGSSPAAQHLASRIPRLALSEVSVLLEGETGVGKTFVARLIHEASPRSREPLRVIDSRRSRRRWSKVSFSAMSAAPSPGRSAIASERSRRQAEALSFWTRWASSPKGARPSSSACSRSASSSASARTTRSSCARESCAPPIATSTRWYRPGSFDRTFCSDWPSSGSGYRRSVSAETTCSTSRGSC